MIDASWLIGFGLGWLLAALGFEVVDNWWRVREWWARLRRPSRVCVGRTWRFVEKGQSRWVPCQRRALRGKMFCPTHNARGHS